MNNLINRISNAFKRQKQPSVNYTYVDRYRLLKYVDQLRSSDKSSMIPAATIEANANGPAANARSLKPYTYSEQIAFLTKKLKENDQLIEERWKGNIDPKSFQTFRMETCLATRLAIMDASSNNKLIIWVSRYNPKGHDGIPSILLLLEDVQNNDQSAHYFSLYNLLLGLLNNSLPKLIYPVYRSNLKDFHNDPLALFQTMSAELVKNPIGFFKNIGAEVLDEQCIQTLYRVRDACLADSSVNISTAVSIGYPIYIMEASDESLNAEKDLYENKDATAVMSDHEHEAHLEAM
ncbi:MAG TPA: hypothetical protein VGQ09_17775 [Chitinophagaceae bacterium]|jgi:hypothetical protein|nr:hypothetical protein [Chitinophagaceae bacterium]